MLNQVRSIIGYWVANRIVYKSINRSHYSRDKCRSRYVLLIFAFDLKSLAVFFAGLLFVNVKSANMEGCDGVCFDLGKLQAVRIALRQSAINSDGLWLHLRL
jgi:hypothetical protein